MKTNLTGLVLSAVALTSSVALADHWDSPEAQPPCDTHQAAPVAAPAGRYELRDTQRWVPARYEEVVVQQCHQRSHGRGYGHWRSRWCAPVTQTRLVPGHFETVQEYVWVPAAPAQQQYSQYPGHAPPRAWQGRVGVRVGFR